MTIHLETLRLRLRDWQETDRPPFAALNADPDVMEFFPAPFERGESDAAIERYQSLIDTHGFGPYAVEIARTGTFIGYVGLEPVNFTAPFTIGRPQPMMGIGWRLSVEAWGHGYASEAAGACFDQAFGIFDLPEIVSFTAETNQRSIAVMERLGMTRDPNDDFEHPNVPEGHVLRPHVLYRMTRGTYTQSRNGAIPLAQ